MVTGQWKVREDNENKIGQPEKNCIWEKKLPDLVRPFPPNTGVVAGSKWTECNSSLGQLAQKCSDVFRHVVL